MGEQQRGSSLPTLLNKARYKHLQTSGAGDRGHSNSYPLSLSLERSVYIDARQRARELSFSTVGVVSQPPIKVNPGVSGLWGDWGGGRNESADDKRNISSSAVPLEKRPLQSGGC